MRERLLADELDLDHGAELDIAFWRGAASRTSGPILELGCGGGRILAALRGRGALIGVDLDPEALELAAERLPAARLFEADARSWRAPESLAAGLVVIGGDLLPLLFDEGDLFALFDTAAQHLAPDGLVGIDATRMDPALLADAAMHSSWEIDIERPAIELLAQELLDSPSEFGAGGELQAVAQGRRAIRESRVTVDPKGRSGVALLSVRHRLVGAAELPASHRRPFPIRAWREGELLAAAEAAGLERIEAHGGATRFRWLMQSRATLAR